MYTTQKQKVKFKDLITRFDDSYGIYTAGSCDDACFFIPSMFFDAHSFEHKEMIVEIIELGSQVEIYPEGYLEPVYIIRPRDEN